MYVCMLCMLCMYECMYVMYVCMYVYLHSKTLPTELVEYLFSFPFTNYTIGAMSSSPFVFVNRKMDKSSVSSHRNKRFKF